MKSEILSLTKKLIRFRTTADNYSELKRCAKFVKDYFKGCDVVVRSYEVNKKPSLVVLFRQTKKPELFLVGHLDVVSAEVEQFVPKVKGNRLYGRGAVDNKASVAIMITLMKSYSKQKHRPDFGLILVSDEETGSKSGVKYLLNKEKYGSEYALVADAGNNYEIVTHQKGELHLKLTAKGKGAHGSRPWKGENAIDKLLDVYFILKKKFPKTTKQNRWKQTINLGMIKGGTAVNKIPDFAEMWLDMRFTGDKEKVKMLNAIKRIKGIKTEVLSEGNVVFTDRSNVYSKALKKSVERVIKRKTKFSRGHGATDARFFAYKNMSTAMIVPVGKGFHAKGEYVEIKSMGKVYDILKDFIDNNIKKL